jgi:transposase, IS6 family
MSRINDGRLTSFLIFAGRPAVIKSNPFKWRHYESEIILLCVRWYLRYALSYRDLEEMMDERGLSLDHTTIYRWVQAYAPELEKRIRSHLRLANGSYRVDETYIKVKGAWKYLYRAVDSTGQTIDFMLSARRDKRAAKRFFRKMLKTAKRQSPRVINVDKNQA